MIPVKPPEGFAFAPPAPAGTPQEGLIGERIKTLRKDLGLTQTGFATALGATQSAVSKWERRDETPSDSFIDRIAALTGTTAGYIRYGEAYQRRRVPIIGMIGAGGAVFALDESGAADEIDGFQVPSLMPYDAVALVMKGDALFPEIDDGAVLIYRRDVPFEAAACLSKRCVVSLRDGRCLVRRVAGGGALGRYTLIAASAPPIADVDIEWAAPILAYISR